MAIGRWQFNSFMTISSLTQGKLIKKRFYDDIIHKIVKQISKPKKMLSNPRCANKDCCQSEWEIDRERETRIRNANKIPNAKRFSLSFFSAFVLLHSTHSRHFDQSVSESLCVYRSARSFQLNLIKCIFLAYAQSEFDRRYGICVLDHVPLALPINFSTQTIRSHEYMPAFDHFTSCSVVCLAFTVAR